MQAGSLKAYTTQKQATLDSLTYLSRRFSPVYLLVYMAHCIKLLCDEGFISILWPFHENVVLTACVLQIAQTV